MVGKNICSAALVAAGLLAAEPVLAVETVTTAGQPFCADQDELKEILLALIKQDMEWVRTLKTCILAKPGIKVVTIENLPSDSEIGHVAKVRLIPQGSRNSFVAYTIVIKK